MNEREPIAPWADEFVGLQFGADRSTIDCLTALAIVDDTTLAVQARRAITDYLQDPAKIEEPIEPKRLTRKVEMLTPPEMADKLGTLATQWSVQKDQVLHAAFDHYIERRLEEPRFHDSDGGEPAGPTDG